ncbi:MAG: hypothetical protein A2806_02470 [Candidatus Terrybacteria bacterium RIFCSPHIGHO2_01_FULL_48_17]|uniref:Galactose oxidase n=1 Tax=Candidatus Terrybacteria bacterium RIFCSPHIGHO2_01_FULL_48_17 TaxID=1802362 RepID=A0A1G2PHU5_9BACT|nr:MAG: hypothetical protein A2806_02470 [Candidatus Terrybacteria bacterium RIFCSPHIGHO2_01_FULL_48_17]OHA53616.1 MAG: hypothetical protein A3A30_00425 [Candidatus Terrybacteria bacterium RIFCSPLOWO2_01_FULL_48_14]
MITQETQHNGSVVEVWQSKASLPTARTEVAAATLGGTIYVVGGLSGYAQTLDTVEAYNPKTNQWTKAPSLPVPVHHTMAVAYEGALYVFGGFTNITFTPTAEVWKFELSKGKWETLGFMPDPKAAGAAVAHDGFIYIIGGVTSQGISPDMLRYDISENKFEPLEQMSDAREHLAAGVIANQIIVVGGRRGGLSGNRGTVEIYDISLREWTIGPKMPTARGGIAAAVLDGKLHVFGGEEVTGTFNIHEVFDPSSGTWQQALAMPTARHGLAAAVLDGAIFVVGGGRRPGLSVSSVNEQYRNVPN